MSLSFFTVDYESGGFVPETKTNPCLNSLKLHYSDFYLLCNWTLEKTNGIVIAGEFPIQSESSFDLKKIREIYCSEFSSKMTQIVTCVIPV